MADRLARGLLDTSVVIELEFLLPATLPVESSISVITLAELSAGPSAVTDPVERAFRQARAQRAEAALNPLPFDVAAARAFGPIVAAVRAHGRQPRGRFTDLLIAATALAQDLPLLTRNPSDFAGLDPLIHVVAV